MMSAATMPENWIDQAFPSSLSSESGSEGTSDDFGRSLLNIKTMTTSASPSPVKTHDTRAQSTDYLP